MPLEKRYSPEQSEPKLREFWSKNGVYDCNWDSDKEFFTIDTPPPTLSGKMHLGHAFSYTQGDFIARFQRMNGKEVFYPFGTDDNGLPTERLVEKQKKVRASKMPRGEFIDLVHQSIKEQIADFTNDWERLGISADFKNSYSTISDHSIATSQKSFLDLFNKGLVHRKLTPISWDTAYQTAIAQAEFESVEQQSSLNDIAFEDADGNELIISTSRPELIPACVALAAHPDDDRYAGLKGSNIKVPISGHSVSLIYDEDVDKEFGTGLMMVCTFGDKEDIAKWHKHKLPLRAIIGEDGRMLSLAGKYEGMRIKEARKQIIEDLEESGQLKSQKKITHAVNVYERSGVEVEYLNTKQWFVKVLDYKQQLLDMADDIKWHPEFMKHRYIHWVENLNWDWCISRQRHYGVPFPVWHHKETGEVVVAELDELPIDPQTQVPRAWKDRADELEPETDVMDTWATSSVTPQIALDWVSDSDKFKQGFPMDIRRQAHDIIRTWAFYTIVKSMHHHGRVPWKEIVISGHALDPKGRKMSKSKGNGIDPEEVIKKYSADALRYWAASSKLGEDLSYQDKDLRTGHKTINKLWNAARFATMHLDDYDGDVPEAELEVIDQWILAELAEVTSKARDFFNDYQYSKAKAEIDNFFWNTFCDYYLELVKDRLYNEDRSDDSRHSAKFTLYTVVLAIIKCFAPIMPHVTEEIFQQFFASREKPDSVHRSLWPVVREEFFSEHSQETGRLVCQLVGEARKYKSENEMSLREDLPLATVHCTSSQRKLIEMALADLQSTARIVDLEFADSDELSLSIK